MPDDERTWTLSGRQIRARSGDETGPAIKTCGQCFATVHASKPVCKHCGYVFPIKRREIPEKEGELVEIDAAQMKIDRIREQSSARDEAALVKLGQQRGMKRPELWARHVLRARAEKAAQRAASGRSN